MRGRDFLDVAHYLDNVEAEAFYRTKVGRAYYAAYLEARAFSEIALNYRRTRTSQEHQDVARLIAAIDRSVSTDLQFLRRFRNAADYDLDLSGKTVRLQAIQATELAETIIARLDELSTGTPAP